MQEPSYLGKVALASIWFRIVLTHVITQGHKDFPTLKYPPNINIWLLIHFLHPWVGSLIP